MELRDMLLIAGCLLGTGLLTILIGALITSLIKKNKRKTSKNRRVCNTVGKGISLLLLAYSCMAAFMGAVCMFAFIIEGDTFILYPTIIAFLIALASMNSAILCYRYKGGSVSFCDDAVVLKLPRQDELVILSPTELQNVTLDRKGRLVVSLHDGSTYKLGAMTVNVHEFLAFAAQYTDDF